MYKNKKHVIGNKDSLIEALNANRKRLSKQARAFTDRGICKLNESSRR